VEKYLILVDCEKHCIDLQCEFMRIDDMYQVKIIHPFEPPFVIMEDLEKQIYAKAAKYILDKGKIISIVTLEKRPINFFHVSIRIEEINRHLSKFKSDPLLNYLFLDTNANL